MEELKSKRDMFFDLTKMDFVGYAMNHKNPHDRSAWAALSIAKWVDIYNVAI